MKWKDPKKTITGKSNNTTERNKSKYIGERRETQKVSRQDQAIQTKHNLLK